MTIKSIIISASILALVGGTVLAVQETNQMPTDQVEDIAPVSETVELAPVDTPALPAPIMVATELANEAVESVELPVLKEEPQPTKAEPPVIPLAPPAPSEDQVVQPRPSNSH